MVGLEMAMGRISWSLDPWIRDVASNPWRLWLERSTLSLLVEIVTLIAETSVPG